MAYSYYNRSLDALLESIKTEIDEMTVLPSYKGSFEGRSTGKKLWTRYSSKNLFSGKDLLYSSLDGVGSEVPSQSQTHHYLKMAIDSGVAKYIYNHIEPLGGEVFVREPYFLVHDHWLNVKIFDIGSIRSIIYDNVRGNQLSRNGMPPYFSSPYSSYSNSNSSFERLFSYCDLECPETEPTIEVVKGII